MSAAREAVSLPEVSARDSVAGLPYWTLLAVAGGHFAVDCCAGIWPVFKTLACLDLVKAGLLADPARGGTPASALSWFLLLMPLALAASLLVPPRQP